MNPETQETPEHLMRRQLRRAGILCVVLGGFYALGLVLAAVEAARGREEAVAGMVGAALGMVLALSGGLGLIKMRAWAWIPAAIAVLPALPLLPVGTALALGVLIPVFKSKHLLG